MSELHPMSVRALVALGVSLLLAIALVACSSDDEPQQTARQVQEGLVEAQSQAIQQTSESQQSEATAEVAATVSEEQQQEAMQEMAEQQEQQAEQEAEQHEEQAVPESDGTRPSVSPSETFFEDYEESVWARTEEDDTVTFALDADQASWALALSYAQRGYVIDPASVRPEEWINAQYYRYPAPRSEDEFGVSLDLIEHPLEPDRLHLLRIGLQAPLIEQTRQVNVIFVVDASGSMVEGDRVQIAGEVLRTILDSLKPDLDRAAILQFSVDPIPSSFVPHTRPDSEFLQASIDRLLPYYGTNVQAGLNLGVQLANDAREAWPDSDNYVVLISDGVANVDATDPFAILESAADLDERNPLRLITVGVGIGQYNDVLLEQLAQYGNGWYYYINSVDQAHETFGQGNWLRLSTPFADQARVQLRWNPETVEAWRVIGYENRRTGDESFADERKEFAELQSGTAVTILVELELSAEARSNAENALNLGDLVVRWRTPRSDESNLQEAALAVAVDAEPDPDVQLAAVVALAADRYGSLEYVGEPATPDVHAVLNRLVELLRNLDWPADASDERLSELRELLDTLAASTSGNDN